MEKINELDFKSITDLKASLNARKISVKEIADIYIKSIKAKKDLELACIPPCTLPTRAASI